MPDLLAARGQMAMSLAFHILFAVAGMAMPLFMVIAEARYRKTGDAIYMELAKRWSKGTAILFAVGAVSGTVLSFELGLLWPKFMLHAGPLVGMPFSLEGFAFFLEAIFLGIYLYGWERVSPSMHLFAGAMVALSGLLSGVFVTAVNAWMNTPRGFVVRNGELVDLDLWAALWTPAFPTQALHMALAAYVSVSFAVMGIHAFSLRKHPNSRFHREALTIAFWVALVSTPLQIGSGDLAAKHLAKEQPIKLAAAEGLFDTQRGAPLTVGGWPDEDAGETNYGVEIPYALSILAHAHPSAEVRGLKEFERHDWPPVAVVHVSFQIMVAAGTLMLLFVLAGAFLAWRKKSIAAMWSPRMLRLATLCGPMGLIALEAGWVVTEVGRQPWVIRGFLRTADAVTPMPGLIVPFTAFTLLYLMLGLVVIVLLRAHVFGVADSEQA